MNVITISAILVFLSSTFIYGESWTRKADFGGNEISGGVGFAIGDKGYIGAGDNGLFFTNDFWEYDPKTNAWTQKVDIPGAGRLSPVGFSIGGKGYMGTGYEDSFLNDFWEYDPGLNVWNQKSDFGGTSRRNAVGFSIGNKGYIGPGTVIGGLEDFWEYDPTSDSWTQKANVGGGPRLEATGFSIGDKGYIGTGAISGVRVRDFWEYDTLFNSWSRKADFPGTGRILAVGFSIGDKGYLGTGDDGSPLFPHTVKDFWEYDPDEDAWTRMPDLPEFERSSAVAFVIGNKGYVGTGKMWTIILSRLYDFWEFDPYWTRKADFGGAAREYAVGFSMGSKGYIGTGNSNPTVGSYTAQSDFWDYNPADNVWTQKADVGGTGRIGGVGFSIGDKGYIGTGIIASLAYSNDFWEFDSSANTWTQKADVGGPARVGATGFSIGGKGYIGTGAMGEFNLLNDFWEYDPSSNTWSEKDNFPGGYRSSAVGFSIGNRGYIGTGVSGSFLNDFWEYNSFTETWSQKTNFGGDPRRDAVGFSIGVKGYIGSGLDGSNAKKDFWEYDPISDSWSHVTDCAGVERYRAVGFAVNGKAYFGTGLGLFGLTGDFWEYDPGPILSGFPIMVVEPTSINEYLLVGGSSSQNMEIANEDLTGEILNYTIGENPEVDWLSAAPASGAITGPGSEDISVNFDASGLSGGTYTTELIVSGDDPLNPSQVVGITLVIQPWSQKADFAGAAREAAVGFSIGGKGYIGTGEDGENYLNDFWEYDTSNNSWTQKSDFGGSARSNAVGFSIGDKGYIGTGFSLPMVRNRDFWEYDPELNVWIQKADFGGVGRTYATGFSIGTKGYIGLGSAGSDYPIDLWEYDPGDNSWTQKADFESSGRWGCVSFSIGDKGYVGTGKNPSWYDQKDFWEYDPVLDAWTQKTDFGGSERFRAAGFAILDKGYIGTGDYGNDFWEYDPSTDQWKQIADFIGAPRWGAVGFSIGFKGYLGTGINESAVVLADFWEFNPGINPAVYPQMEITPATISEGLTTDGSSERLLKIANHNQTGAILNYTIGQNPQVSWLDINTVAGSLLGPDSISIILTFDATGLEDGIYTTELSVSGNDPFNPLQIVDVILSIQPFTWIHQQSGTIDPLYKVDFTDMYTGTAVGANGTIVRTKDGGASWIAQNSGTNLALWDVSFADNENGNITGYYPILLRTNDGGDNWSGQSHSASSSLVSVCLTSPDTGTIVGYTGVIIHTTNGGDNWVNQTSGTSWALRSVTFTDGLTGTAVGDAGTILRTVDGSTWNPQTSGTEEWLQGVCFTDKDTGTVVGGNGTILRTTDGGANWSGQNSGTNMTLHDVSFINGSIGMVVGMSGTILYTADGGANWSSQSAGTTANLNGVSFTDGQTAIIVGDIGLILRTSTGQYPPLMTVIPDSIRDTLAVGDSIDYVLTVYNHRDLQSQLDYEITETPPVDWLNLSEYSGSVSGGNFDQLDLQLLTSGLTSDVYYTSLTISGNDPSNASDTVYITLHVTEQPKIPILIYPQDSTTIDSSTITLMWRKSERAESYHFQLAEDDVFSTIMINEQELPDTLYTAVGLENQQTYYWRVSSRNEHGASNWSEVRNFTTDIISGLFDDNALPAEFMLFQNYPNPFNPLTKIRYGIPKRNHVRLEVYNLLGQKVATLVNEEQEPNYYVIPFSAMELSSGFYIYRIIAGDFIKTKKMLILK